MMLKTRTLLVSIDEVVSVPSMEAVVFQKPSDVLQTLSSVLYMDAIGGKDAAAIFENK